MPFLERSPELRVYYETQGDSGPWITLINGHTRPLSDFKAMSRFLSERKYRVLSFDSRGVGKTDTPPGFSMQDIAEDVSALWDTLCIPRSTVLGISFGGAIALHVASSFPDRIQSLIIVSTAVNEGFLSIEQEAPPRDPKKLIMNFSRYFSKGFHEKNPLLVQGFIRQVARTFQDPELALGARTQREAMAEFDLLPELSKISAPTLILHGEEDRIVPLQSAKEIQKGVSGAKLESFPGIGHLLLVEMPLAFYERVHGFLQETAPST